MAQDRRWGATGGMLWPAFTLAASALVLVSVFMLDKFQSREYESTLWLVRDFRLARLELTSALLRLDIAPEDGAAEARAEADQSLERLNHALKSVPQHEASSAGSALAPLIAELRQRIATNPTHPLQGVAGRPARETLRALEVELAKIDSGNAAKLRSLQQAQRNQFDAALAAAMALLAAVGVGMWRSARRLGQAETARREVESRWRVTLELLPQMVWSCAPDGSCDYLSPRWLDFTGVPLKQQLGMGWLQQIHPDDRESMLAQWRRAIATGSDWQAESRVRRHDGAYRWAEHRAGRLLAADGHLLRWLGTSTDITERKEAEAELQRHREQLEILVAERTQALERAHAQLQDAEVFVRLVADTIPGQVIYWDRDLRCRFMNRAWGEWFGTPAHQAIGQSVLELRGPAAFDKVKARILAALAGEEQDFEREEFSVSGQHAIMRVQYLPDMRDGEVRGFVVLATDITRHKQAEQLLRLSNEQLAAARDKADEANRAKSTFLANMSHEIRTPMNAIIGLTHMLRREVEDPVHLERLGKIWDAAHHLLQVINDILDLSKIEAGKLVLEDIDFALDTLLTRTCAMVMQPVREKGLELVLDTGQLPRRLHGDPTRLMQALLNLLANAVKFTQQGSIRVRGELLSSTPQELHIRFEVRDTGSGVQPEVLARLFNPFAQADSSSTRQYGGTGLGLVITRHIAELMGGQAGADSTQGLGSTFWFTARMQPAQSEPQTTTPVLRGLRALLVDDLPDAREALGDMLRVLGLRTDTAAEGEQALGLVGAAIEAQDPYAVVLLDWAMPGMDGFATAARLRMRHDPPPPLVLVSARDHAQLQHDARATGFSAVLLKPVTPSMLLDCLMRVVRIGTLATVPSPSPQEASEETVRTRHRGARILLAEDNPVNQEVASELLQAAGMEVDVAGNGEQALRMARRQRYDLILMDMQMPGMDGLQATRMLRQDPENASLPIIAMTANAFVEDRQACLDAGMNDHLAKPVDPRVLHAALMRWLPAREVAAPAPEPTQAPPASIAGRLSRITLLDVDAAYRYCLNKPEIVLRVLQQFVSHYRHASTALLDSVQAGERDEPRRKLHALRGACAPIGAERLRAQAAALEQALRDGASGQEVLAAARVLCADLDALVEELAAVL